MEAIKDEVAKFVDEKLSSVQARVVTKEADYKKVVATSNPDLAK